MEAVDESGGERTNSLDTDPEKQQSSQDEAEDYEAEGRRMLLLRKAIQKTVRGCVAAGRFSLFAKCHPSMTKKKLKSLQGIHKQYQVNLQKAIETEVEVMFDEENIAQLMNKLDDIIANGATSDPDPAWRPTGDPDNDIRAHLLPSKLKTKERLTRILTSIEEQNADLSKATAAQKQAHQETDAAIADTIHSLTQVPQEIDMKEIDNFIKVNMM